MVTCARLVVVRSKLNGQVLRHKSSVKLLSTSMDEKSIPSSDVDSTYREDFNFYTIL